MSLRPFTNATAPRQGGKPLRKVKLTAEAMRVLKAIARLAKARRRTLRFTSGKSGRLARVGNRDARS